MSFAAVQKHVAILERAGLITKERIGRRKVVRTNLEGVLVARRLLDRYEELWRGRVDRMTALVADDRKEPTDDRDRCSQGSAVPDPDARSRVRRAARSRVAAVGRPAPARAVVGSADLPCDRRLARPALRRPRRLPHDGSDGRPAARLLGDRLGRASAPSGVPRRLLERRRDAERRAPEERRRRHDPGARRRAHADGDRQHLPRHRRDGADPRDGHGGRPDPGGRPDRRAARRGRRHERRGTAEPRRPR